MIEYPIVIMKQMLITIAAVVLVGCGDPNIQLIEAVNSGNIELARKALSNGADPNIKGELESSVLENALSQTHELAQLLIDQGADVNKGTLHSVVKSGIGLWGRNPVFLGVAVNSTKFLIKNGADVNMKDSNGRSPLHCVDAVEITKILIDAGANVNALNEFSSPLDPYPFREITKYDYDLRGTPLDVISSHFPMLHIDPSGFKNLQEKQLKEIKEYNLIVNLLRKHGGKTGEELKAEGR